MRCPADAGLRDHRLGKVQSARRVLDRGFEALWVEGRHTLDPAQTLGGVPDGEREHGCRPNPCSGTEKKAPLATSSHRAAGGCLYKMSGTRLSGRALSHRHGTGDERRG